MFQTMVMLGFIGNILMLLYKVYSITSIKPENKTAINLWYPLILAAIFLFLNFAGMMGMLSTEINIVDSTGTTVISNTEYYSAGWLLRLSSWIFGVTAILTFVDILLSVTNRPFRSDKQGLQAY